MIYLLTGKNSKEIEKEVKNIVTSFLKENKNTSTQKFTGTNIELHDLTYKSVGQSLFGEKNIYIINDFINDNANDFIKVINNFANSQDIFIFIEDTVKKDIEKEVALHGGTIKDFKVVEKNYDNPFAITDAIASRDKKLAWKLYLNEIKNGVDAMAVYGRFVWIAKTIYMIKKFEKENAASLAISPYVYTKTKQLSKNWTTNDIQEFYEELLFGLPENSSMEYFLEKVILEKL